MEYTAGSIKEVIGRVIRNTRLQDSSYISDMNEWIPEAMGYMNTHIVLQLKWADVTVDFHKGKLPNGLKSLDAVEYNGTRLKFSRQVKPYTAPNTQQLVVDYISDPPVAVYTALDEGITSTVITATSVTEASTPSFITDIRALQSLPFNEHSYYTELGYLNTSLTSGKVRVYYRALPTDCDGFPLIVDNENYKQALYWYVRAQIIGTGFMDKVFTYRDCMASFELYAARAMGEITYPSIDQVEASVAMSTSLLTAEDYFSTFNTIQSEEGMLG